MAVAIVPVGFFGRVTFVSVIMPVVLSIENG